MANQRTAATVFTDEFLPIRAKLLEVAASLDRLDRAGFIGDSEPRRAQIEAAIEVLLRSEGDRAEQLQMIFSREYEEDWRSTFGLKAD